MSADNADLKTCTLADLEWLAVDAINALRHTGYADRQLEARYQEIRKEISARAGR